MKKFANDLREVANAINQLKLTVQEHQREIADFQADLAAGIVTIQGYWEAFKDIPVVDTFITNLETSWAQFEEIYANAVQFLSHPIEGLKEAWSYLWPAITDTAKSAWEGLVSYFSGAVAQIGSIFQSIGDAIKQPFIAAFDAIKSAWDNLTSWIRSFKMPSFSLPSWLGGGGGGAPAPAPAAAPPGAQLGGIFNQRSMLQVAERGPEAIIPLSGGRRAEGLLSYANRVMGMGRPTAGPTNVSFAPNITINGNATEAEQRAMDSRLRDLASDFIAQFKAAQQQERRLSYESGYG
jgi:hypothetical protein